jgi:hypothetical protein
MEWTKAEVIGTSFLQFYKSADNIKDINTGLNLLYGVLRDQASNIIRLLPQEAAGFSPCLKGPLVIIFSL